MSFTVPPTDRQGPQVTASENSGAVKDGNQKKRLNKKRKPAGHKAANKAAKRARSKNKTLKPSAPVNGTVKVNSSDHAGVKADIGVGSKKTGKKGVKKNKKKAPAVVVEEKKGKPAQPGQAVGSSDLYVPPNAAADNVLGQEGRQRLDGPRKGDQGGSLGKLRRAEPDLLDEKVSHHGDRNLQEQAEAEVAEEHVSIPAEVANDTLINWEHFSLAYEEYCLTKEVTKN